MWPFGSEEKKAGQAAAEAEVQRLHDLPVPDLAAEVMPAFGPGGMNIKSGHQQGAIQVVDWLLADCKAKASLRQRVVAPTIEALQALEHAGLLDASNFGSRATVKTYRPTRAGETALAEGTVSQQLNK
jgi:hypothetical protein